MLSPCALSMLVYMCELVPVKLMQVVQKRYANWQLQVGWNVRHFCLHDYPGASCCSWLVKRLIDYSGGCGRYEQCSSRRRWRGMARRSSLEPRGALMLLTIPCRKMNLQMYLRLQQSMHSEHYCQIPRLLSFGVSLLRGRKPDNMSSFWPALLPLGCSCSLLPSSISTSRQREG